MEITTNFSKWPSLYSVTGDIRGINIMLVPVEDMREIKMECDTLKSLLSEVSSTFTRVDDLPDNLLPRIDEILSN